MGLGSGLPGSDIIATTIRIRFVFVIRSQFARAISFHFYLAAAGLRTAVLGLAAQAAGPSYSQSAHLTDNAASTRVNDRVVPCTVQLRYSTIIS